MSKCPKWNTTLRVGSHFLGEGNGTPLQYSWLENPMDGGAWWAAVHGVAKSQTRLSDFTLTFHFHALEKEMATHSSTLGWKIPWTEEAGRLQSMGSQRVRHNWATSLYRHIHSSSNHKRVSQKTKLIGWMVKGEDRKNILSDSILTTPQFSILREIMHFSSIIL